MNEQGAMLKGTRATEVREVRRPERFGSWDGEVDGLYWEVLRFVHDGQVIEHVSVTKRTPVKRGKSHGSAG